MKSLKNKKIIIPVIAIILLIVGISIYNSINKRDDFIVGKTLNITNPTDYLVQYDNGDYYLMKANTDIKFSVESEEKEIKYTITDEDNQEVDTKVNKKKKHFEIAADKDYEAGKTYKLTLENASFTEEKLKDIKTLYFTIVRPNANTQVLNDDVIKVDKNTITSVEKDDNYYQFISNKEFRENDILYYQNENETIAFKVNSVTKENDSYVIQTTSPTLEEVFKELDIYGEFNLRLDDFITNEELKDYIKVAIEKDGLLDNIVPKVDAAEVFNVKVTNQRDGGFKVKVSLILEHGQKSSLKSLEKHDLKLNIEFLVKLKAHSDIGFFHQDIGANLEIEMGTEFKIESHDDDFLSLKKELEEGEELTVSFSGLSLDEDEETKPLIQTFIPLPVPGFNVNCKVSLLKEVKIALEAALKAKSNMNIGFGYNNQGFYRQFDLQAKENNYSILGKGEAKLGFETNVNLNFIGILEAGINLPIGVYGEGEISAAGSNKKQEYQGKFEFGAFVGADLYAEFKILKLQLAEAKVSYEKKMPIIELEGSATVDNQDNCEEKLLNGDFSCYAGTYTYIAGYSYGDESKLTLDKDGKITMNNSKNSSETLSVQKEEDGTYRLEHQFYFETPSGEIVPTTQYFYLAPIDVKLSYYSTQGEFEETDKTKIRIKKEGFIAADTNVVYQKDEGNNENCEEKILNGDFSCYVGTYTSEEEVARGSNNDTYKLTLKRDGSLTINVMAKKNYGKVVSVSKTEKGYYTCNITGTFKDEKHEGFYLYPVGVVSRNGAKADKVRIIPVINHTSFGPYIKD